MNLKVFDCDKTDGKNLPIVSYSRPHYLKNFYNSDFEGYIEQEIRCREDLYLKISHINFFEKISGVQLIKGIRDYPYTNRIAKSLIENTSFGSNFFVDDFGYISTKLLVAPQIFSILSLILREMVTKNLFTFSEVPLSILESVYRGKRTVFKKDYIFSAFYSYIFLDTNFKETANHLILTPEFGKANGPGKEFHGYLLEHLELSDDTGFIKAGSWWKKEEVKTLLNSIIETYYHDQKNTYKLFKMLMEE
jgi:hypothetical protein